VFEAAALDFAPALAAGADFGAAGFFDDLTGAACLATGRADLVDLLLELEDFAGAAFRTGGFAAAARFGLGFAASVVNLRPLAEAEAFGAALCGAGREELLFAPLMTGSLMRSTRFFRERFPWGQGSRRPPALYHTRWSKSTGK
ncbi:MAG TPA: hypothetical protein VNZ44_15655, partial [Pyrinomonadaceae bacterium]|nr:hypothetical protein [Pyrinomonadaceae bacterium]